MNPPVSIPWELGLQAFTTTPTILGIEPRSSYILGKNGSTELHAQLKWKLSFRFNVIQTTASRSPVSGKYGYQDVNENFCGAEHSGTHLWSWHSVQRQKECKLEAILTRYWNPISKPKQDKILLNNWGVNGVYAECTADLTDGLGCEAILRQTLLSTCWP